MAGTAVPKASTRRRGLDPARGEEYRGWLRQMMLIRHFEEKAGEAYSLGKIGGFCHLYIGQEAVAVGSLAALRPDDYITCSYREHGHALARGIEAAPARARLGGGGAGHQPALRAAATCSHAWYDDRVSGLDCTCENPIATPRSRSSANSSGV